MQHERDHLEESGLDLELPLNRRSLTVVVVVLTMLSGGWSMIPVFAPRIMELYDLTNEQYGTMIGLRGIAAIPGYVVVGPLIVAFGTRRVAEASLFGTGLFFFIWGIVPTLLSLQCCVIGLGFFLSLFSVAIPALLISLFPQRKRGMFAVNLVALALPSMFFPFIADRVVQWSLENDSPDIVVHESAASGPQDSELMAESTEGGSKDVEKAFIAKRMFVPFAVVGAVLLLGTCFLCVWKRNLPLDSKGSLPQGQDKSCLPDNSSSLISRVQLFVQQLLSVRALLVVVLIALHGSADNTVYMFLPAFMESQFEHLPLATAWAVSAHGLAYVVTRSILSVTPENIGQRAILTLVGPIGGSVVIGMLWFSPALAVPALYFLASLLFAAEFPTLVSELSSRSMGAFGTILATGLLVGEVATFTMLKGTGWLADRTGGDYRIALSVAACGFLAFGCIAMVSGIGRKGEMSFEEG